MKLKELFQDPEKWTQKAYARDSFGSPVVSTEHEAYSFCLIGGLNRCYLGDNAARVAAYDKIRLELKSSFGVTVPQWNDDPARTHQEVLDLVTRLDV